MSRKRSGPRPHLVGPATQVTASAGAPRCLPGECSPSASSSGAPGCGVCESRGRARFGSWRSSCVQTHPKFPRGPDRLLPQGFAHRVFPVGVQARCNASVLACLAWIFWLLEGRDRLGQALVVRRSGQGLFQKGLREVLRRRSGASGRFVPSPSEVRKGERMSVPDERPATAGAWAPARMLGRDRQRSGCRASCAKGASRVATGRRRAAGRHVITSSGQNW